jgi:hypothetical protein
VNSTSTVLWEPGRATVPGYPTSHVHLGRVAQSSTAVGILHLRPRASVVVRAGTISSLATAVLLWVVAREEPHLVGVLGTVATLLLVVPGGLSAYVARPRENPLTSSMVFGLRLLTMASGFIALLAASTVALAHRWNVTAKGEVRSAGEWRYSGLVLWVCFWASLAIFIVLAVTWLWTIRMPERSRGLEAPG